MSWNKDVFNPFPENFVAAMYRFENGLQSVRNDVAISLFPNDVFLVRVHSSMLIQLFTPVRLSFFSKAIDVSLQTISLCQSITQEQLCIVRDRLFHWHATERQEQT